MMSVICVYNDEKILNKVLLQGLKSQVCEYDLVLVDNRAGAFPSAAAALNFGAKQAKGQYLAFIHQDVFIYPETNFMSLEKMLDQIPDLAVAGAAGWSSGGVVACDMEDDVRIKKKKLTKNPVTVPTRAQVLDECLFIIPAEVYRRKQLDEETCNDWHCYSIDYCVSSLTLGYKNYAVPMKIYHQSDGGIRTWPFIVYPARFYKSLARVLKKHRADHETIWAVGSEWATRQSLMSQVINKAIRNFFKVTAGFFRKVMCRAKRIIDWSKDKVSKEVI